MSGEWFVNFKQGGTISLKETPEDQRLENHRAALRCAQRERRNARMQRHVTPTLSPPKVKKDGSRVLVACRDIQAARY